MGLLCARFVCMRLSLMCTQCVVNQSSDCTFTYSKIYIKPLPFSVSGPQYNDLVKVVGLLELSDVALNVLHVLPFSSGYNVVRSKMDQDKIIL